MFHYKLLHDIGYNSPGYIIYSHCLSILYIVDYIYSYPRTSPTTFVMHRLRLVQNSEVTQLCNDSAYLTFMHSMSCEMLVWMDHKLESSLTGEIRKNSNMQIIPL